MPQRLHDDHHRRRRLDAGFELGPVHDVDVRDEDRVVSEDVLQVARAA